MNKQDEKLKHVRPCFCKWACKICQTDCVTEENRNNQEIINAQSIQEHKCNAENCWECNDVLC